jgi:hypothetical protein
MVLAKNTKYLQNLSRFGPFIRVCLFRVRFMSFLLLSNQNIFPSMFLGLLFTVLLFIICFFVVVGIKFCVLLSMRKNPFNEKGNELGDIKVKKQRKRIRTVYVDPDEVDRICVKKSS